MRLVSITQPTDPVPSLDEVKAHLRMVGVTDDDGDILSKIWGAITEFEDTQLGWLGRSISPRQIEVRADHFCSTFYLPRPPILTGGSYTLTVKYDDEDGAEQTIAGTVYRLVDPETTKARIILREDQSWPTDLINDESSVRIRYWAGYPSDDVRISNFKSAVKLHVQLTYDGDEDEKLRLSQTIDRLLNVYRIYS
jgi:hypothetical protein